jgi:hypothetical protein
VTPIGISSLELLFQIPRVTTFYFCSFALIEKEQPMRPQLPNETQAIVADSCDLVDDQMERFLKHLESQDYVDVQTD